MIRIIEDKNMVIVKQLRTHRKKRINKKWAKRYGHSARPNPDAIMIGGNLCVMHPETAAHFRELVRKSLPLAHTISVAAWAALDEPELDITPKPDGAAYTASREIKPLWGTSIMEPIIPIIKNRSVITDVTS